MLSLESQGALLSAPVNGARGGNRPVVRTNTARIAERVSFGKTATCIALVCASRCPPLLPQIVNIDSDNSPFVLPGSAVFPRLELRRPRLISATLVVCATATLTQWEENLRRHAPGIRYLVVDSVHALRRFHRALEAGGLGDTELVLLRAGSVSTSFAVKGERVCHPAGGRASKKTRPITVAMRAVTAGYVWARLVVDDFDMIRIGWGDVFVPSVFTWLVSATNRRVTSGRSAGPVPHARGGTVREYARRAATLPMPTAATDIAFDHGLRIQCDKKYVDACVGSLRPTFRRVTVKPTTATGILEALGVGADVAEMAETGAIETAAEQLGMRVDNMRDLLARVLDKNVAQYQEALAGLRAVRETRARLGPPAEGAAPEQTAATPELLAALSETEAELEAAKKKHGGRLERMRDNLRQGWCQGCMVPWEDSDDEEGDDEEAPVYVMNCCQVVLCDVCTVRPGPRYLSRCPNCAARVDPARDIICVSADLDRVALVGEGEVEVTAAGPAKQGARYSRWAGQPRFRTLFQLVEGAPLDAVHEDCAVPQDRVVPPGSLVTGRDFVPRKKGEALRILVFTAHRESSARILEGLQFLGVPAAWLKGGRKERDRVVRAFKEGGVQVLVVTSDTDSAGLHLPEATHVVMFHHHASQETVVQMVGRAQRVGRTCSLEVVAIV